MVPIELPDDAVALHIGRLTLRVLALEHALAQVTAQLAAGTPPVPAEPEAAP